MSEFYQERLELFPAAFKTGKMTFTPRNIIMGKGIACVQPFDLLKLNLKTTNVVEIHNSPDSTVEFLFDNEIAYFNARSKGLV